MEWQANFIDGILAQQWSGHVKIFSCFMRMDKHDIVLANRITVYWNLCKLAVLNQL